MKLLLKPIAIYYKALDDSGYQEYIAFETFLIKARLISNITYFKTVKKLPKLPIKIGFYNNLLKKLFGEVVYKSRQNLLELLYIQTVNHIKKTYI